MPKTTTPVPMKVKPTSLAASGAVLAKKQPSKARRQPVNPYLKGVPK